MLPIEKQGWCEDYFRQQFSKIWEPGRARDQRPDSEDPLEFMKYNLRQAKKGAKTGEDLVNIYIGKILSFSQRYGIRLSKAGTSRKELRGLARQNKTAIAKKNFKFAKLALKALESKCSPNAVRKALIFGLENGVVSPLNQLFKETDRTEFRKMLVGKMKERARVGNGLFHQAMISTKIPAKGRIRHEIISILKLLKIGASEGKLEKIFRY